MRVHYDPNTKLLRAKPESPTSTETNPESTSGYTTRSCQAERKQIWGDTRDFPNKLGSFRVFRQNSIGSGGRPGGGGSGHRCRARGRAGVRPPRRHDQHDEHDGAYRAGGAPVHGWGDAGAAEGSGPLEAGPLDRATGQPAGAGVRELPQLPGHAHRPPGWARGCYRVGDCDGVVQRRPGFHRTAVGYTESGRRVSSGRRSTEHRGRS